MNLDARLQERIKTLETEQSSTQQYLTQRAHRQEPSAEPYVPTLLEALRKEYEWLRKAPTRKEAYSFLGRKAEELQVPSAVREKAIARTLNEIYAYGKLQEAMDDPHVSDIQVYGGQATFIYRNGRREPFHEGVMSDREVHEFVLRVLAGTPYRFDLTTPRTDAILPDGSRLHVRGGASGWTVQVGEGKRVTRDCMILTIRKPLHNFSLEELQQFGMFSPEMGSYLDWVMKLGESFIVGGDVGSGKSTLMAAAMGKIPPGNMSCIIEEMPELQPLGEWVARLYNRAPSEEGKGGITMVDNLVDTLRMFYDNVYVGETRTEDVAYWLHQVALTVTRQTATTTHATEGANTVIRRIVSLALGSDRRPTPASLGDTFCSTIRHVLVAHKTPHGRRLTEMAAILPFDYERKAVPYVTVAEWNGYTNQFVFHGLPPGMSERAQLQGYALTLPGFNPDTMPVRYVPLV